MTIIEYVQRNEDLKDVITYGLGVCTFDEFETELKNVDIFDVSYFQTHTFNKHITKALCLFYTFFLLEGMSERCLNILFDLLKQLRNAEMYNALSDDDKAALLKASDPTHYKQSKIECIDAIKSAVIFSNSMCTYYLGNIFKYIWRYDKKGKSIEDLQKALTYLSWVYDLKEDLIMPK